MQALAGRNGVFSKATVRPARLAVPVRAPLVISNSYKNKENIDLSKVQPFMRNEKDTGSSEAQIARLSARIAQISSHLSTNRKDFAAKRGLEAVLAQRKSLLKYLLKTDRATYNKVIQAFGIKSIAAVDTRGAARNTEDKETA